MTTLYITHKACKKHKNGPSHPESPERLTTIEAALDHEDFAALTRKAGTKAKSDLFTLVHPQNYVSLIKNARPDEGEDESYVHIDPDTAMNTHTWPALRGAVGAAIEAVDAIMKNQHENAFVAIRPPGHHAETARACGFCIFNIIAIAAIHARRTHGAERVAVIDFDVHHGNGTQDIFWSDKNLFYGSTHQMPLFPGTGAIGETGVGNICNAPLSAGDGSEQFKAAMQDRIIPALKNFSPDLILLSAGFDAHINDPLAGLNLREEDFAWITREMLTIASKHTNGRLVSILEGGYHLQSLGSSVAAHVKELMTASSR